ncbi:hypothetical protein NP233_g3726 [Leucocoprinus birnbaumii]|uniref:DUF7918 domain-containing protein n=1 Tax=Leucocoprinus birnbaumii TaxID=56174 RepID=A0AAD5YTM9_9AGAR|nr:hypothetical protein NP233_g3726 [Leucocoprinus birnbaumii]
MPTYDNITIKIQISGEDVPEYFVETDQTAKTISCWEFSVIVNAEKRSRTWAAEFKADGHSAFCRAFTGGPTINKDIGWFDESLHTRRRLMFSEIHLVDDDNLLQASPETRIGEIQVRCCYFEAMGEDNAHISSSSFGTTEKLHEKAKKGISQRVGLGKSEQVAVSWRYIPKWQEDIVTFLFRYRPLGWLQAQGIAPPPPKAPTPAVELGSTKPETAHKRDPEAKVKKEDPENLEISGDEDEDDQELERLLTQVEEVRARKRRRKQQGGPSQKKVKREELPRGFHGEVIDLT